MKKRSVPLLLALSFFKPLTSAGSYTAWQADRCYREGDLSKAREGYENAVAANPDDMQSLYNVGKVALKQKEFKTAVKAFTHVATSSKSSSLLKEQSFFNRGDAELLEKNLSDARQSYKKVLELNPANEHAKKRLELLDRLEQEQKKEEEKKKDQKKQDQQKSDSDKDQKNGQDQSESNKEESSESQKDGSSPEQNENRSNESSDKGQQKKEQQEQRRQENTDKADKKGSEKQDSQKQRGQQGKHDQSASQKNETQQGQDNKDTKKHTDPSGSEKKSDEKAPQSAKTGTKAEKSIPEQQLNAQEQALLEQAENHDKRAYKYFLGRADSQEAQRPGQKNW